MARPAALITQHYQRALSMWPKDELRSQVQFSDFVKRGIDKRLDGGKPANEAAELKQLNALYTLAEDRYKERFPLPLRGKILNPQSQPTYFQDLLRELEEAPSRSWLQNVSKRLTGMFRWE